MRSEIRRAVDRAFTAFWGNAMRLARPPAAVQRWTSAGNQRVSVIAPHPDDEVAGCGGALLRHRANADRVSVFYATDGSGTRAFRGIPHTEIGKQRAGEAAAARGVLGIARHRWLGLREWHWAEEELAGPLDQFLIDEDPAVLYAPSLVDFHPEHIRVARVLARVLESPKHRFREIRIYQVQAPLTTVLVNLVAPIGEVLPVVLAAADAYPSQRASLRAPLRLKRYAGRRHGIGEDAEEFWEITALAYSALHRGAEIRSAVGAFRGLRRLAITDPLAFIARRGGRRRLRLMAGG